LAWTEEKITVLVKACPTWSQKLGKYTICTGGINEKGEWRRIYPMPQPVVMEKQISLWNVIKVQVSEETSDPRKETRLIKPESIVDLGPELKTREQKRAFIAKHTDVSLNNPSKNRTCCIIKPQLIDLEVIKRKPAFSQATLYGGVFKKNPYEDIGLFYTFCCENRCQICQNQPHRMECFDWGANYLFRRYDDETIAAQKVREMGFTRMTTENELWFVMGTHRKYPFLHWLLVGVLWMKREVKNEGGGRQCVL
jgi:hypothetical protein